jgi:hypothetical protein
MALSTITAINMAVRPGKIKKTEAVDPSLGGEEGAM